MVAIYELTRTKTFLPAMLYLPSPTFLTASLEHFLESHWQCFWAIFVACSTLMSSSLSGCVGDDSRSSALLSSCDHSSSVWSLGRPSLPLTSRSTSVLLPSLADLYEKRNEYMMCFYLRAKRDCVMISKWLWLNPPNMF